MVGYPGLWSQVFSEGTPSPVISPVQSPVTVPIRVVPGGVHQPTHLSSQSHITIFEKFSERKDLMGKNSFNARTELDLYFLDEMIFLSILVFFFMFSS